MNLTGAHVEISKGEAVSERWFLRVCRVEVDPAHQSFLDLVRLRVAFYARDSQVKGYVA